MNENEVITDYGTSIIAELIQGNGKPVTEHFYMPHPDARKVPAKLLKQTLLTHFNESNEAYLENEPEADENIGYHLLGLDQNGQKSVFQETDEIDLNQYQSFQITSRVLGGNKDQIQ